MVILGLAVVMLGRKLSVGWLADADPIAALVVACVVVYVSWRLARQTIDALLDAAPTGVRARIMDEVRSVEGVLEVDRARIRRAGNRYFADLEIGMHRNVTFQKSEQLGQRVTEAVHRVLPDMKGIILDMNLSLIKEYKFDFGCFAMYPDNIKNKGIWNE